MNNATATNGKAPSQDVVAVIVGALSAMGYSADQNCAHPSNCKLQLENGRSRTWYSLTVSLNSVIDRIIRLICVNKNL